MKVGHLRSPAGGLCGVMAIHTAVRPSGGAVRSVAGGRALALALAVIWGGGEVG